MKIAIVEDEKEHARLLELYIQNWADKKKQQVICRIYVSPEAFLFDWAEEKDFSVLFLDIQMPGMNGMVLAKRIRQESDSVGIVFTTGIADFLQEGYEVSAIHYLLKPILPEKVEACLERVNRREKKELPCLVLHLEEGIQRFVTEQVWWICAMGHHVTVGVEEKKQPSATPADPDAAVCRVQRLEAADSIGDVEKMLPPDGSFVRCHRSYLVNLAHVYRIEKAEIILDNGDRIPLSRRLYKTVNDGFIRYYQERRQQS